MNFVIFGRYLTKLLEMPLYKGEMTSEVCLRYLTYTSLIPHSYLTHTSLIPHSLPLDNVKKQELPFLSCETHLRAIQLNLSEV